MWKGLATSKISSIQYSIVATSLTLGFPLVTFHCKKVYMTAQCLTDRHCLSSLPHTHTLSLDTTQPFYVSALTCTGHKILAGTFIGAVAILDSKSTDLLSYLNWHNDNVQALLVLPKQTESCTCAEIPFPKKDKSDTTSSDSVLVVSVGKEGEVFRTHR